MGKIIQIEGAGDSSLPLVSQSAAEIAVANFPSLSAWPSVFQAGISGIGFADRVTQAAYDLNGAASAATQLVTDAAGVTGYAITNINQAIKVSINTTESFTLAMCVKGGVSLGSFSSQTNNWSIYHDSAAASPTWGNIRVGFGGQTLTFAEYTGPSLTTDNTIWHTLVLIVDRDAQTFELRVDGASAGSKTGVSGAVLSELALGIYNVNGTQGFRVNTFFEPILFNKALNVSELATLESMLSGLIE